MATYSVQGQGGELGPVEADSPEGALDAVSRLAGYADHAAACAATGDAVDDWTTSRTAFRGGSVLLLVTEVEQ